MRVLVGCEFSGVVRDAFRFLGHEAWSCDLLPSEAGGPHYQGDVMTLLDGWQPVNFAQECDQDGDGWCQIRDCDPSECGCIGPTQDGIEYMERDGVLFGRPEESPAWDMAIFHPPCTYLAVSGMHRTVRGLRDPQLTEDALVFVRALMDAPINRIALENPVGVISSRIRKPDQIIQPYEFGHDASKKTCLWLKNLPLLRPTSYIKPRLLMVCLGGRTKQTADKTVYLRQRTDGRCGPRHMPESRRQWPSSGARLMYLN